MFHGYDSDSGQRIRGGKLTCFQQYAGPGCAGAGDCHIQS